MHRNLFSFGNSRREIKAALNEHQKRDSRTLAALDIVFALCVIYLVRNQPPFDAIAILGAAYTAMTGMRYFVDQSARNFYLHRLDWEDAGPDD